ncbi:MAG: histidine kinase [Kibdelosporangium sp.]
MTKRWPRLLPAVALAVESVAAFHWAELTAGVLLLAATTVFFERFPISTLCLLVAAAAVPTLVLAPTSANPPWLWPFLAAAVSGFLVGRQGMDILPSLGAVLVAGLPISVLVDSSARGGFGLLFGLYDWLVLVLALLVVVVLPWLAGRYRRQRADLIAAGWERAALLESQQKLEVERVRLRERARIARDMHDSLGHEWGLIALRAAALEVSIDLPQQQREIAGELRAGVADATGHLREIIGMLDYERTDIAGLVERARKAGMAVVWEPSELPTAVERAAHRVVQEGLTNAAKHAPGATVTIDFEHAPDTTVVRVSNEPGNSSDAVSGGYGLVGLRERVRLLGGTLDAGPREDGGYALVATLAHHAPPVDPAPVDPALDDLARASGEARRGFARAIRVPALAAATVVVLGLGLFALVGLGNSLEPAVFDRIAVGAARSDVDPQLPPFQILGDPERLLPVPPPGTECQQYWSTRQTDEQLFFRLCFADGRLTAKQAVPRSAISR